MRFSFKPRFEGEVSSDRIPDDFLARIERRVRDGLFIPGSRVRANYRVLSSSREALAFEAADFLTAWNVGLNDVELRRSTPSTIAYRVGFGRWTRYCVIQGALLGAILAGCYAFIPAMRRDVASFPNGPVIFWGMAIFWTLCWPWLLTALHRPFARRALDRILLEELGRSAPARSVA
jgi:hypothetical protein